MLAATVAAEGLYRATGTTRLSMVFLTAVLASAYVLGSGPAYFAACAAFLVYNFYLVEPRFSLTLGTPEDVLNLVVFFIAAMLTGNLTGRVRDEAQRAERRAALTRLLFDASRSFSAASDEAAIRQELAAKLARAGGGQAFVRNGGSLTSEPTTFTPDAELLHVAIDAASRARRGETHTTHFAGWTFRPLYADASVHGVAAWMAAPATLDDEQALLDILVDAGAAAVVRAKLAAAKAEAETRARTEDLRNALLSSISHDLRTPLAAIMASASSLKEFGDGFEPAVRRDLADTIQEEAQRLDAFVGNLLNMTRLEAGAVQVRSAPFSLPEVLGRSIGRRAAATRRAIATDFRPGLPDVLGDAVLFEQVIGNVLDNALRYSPADRPIRVSAAADHGAVVVTVEDEGPGVPDGDLSRIFEKFYRCDGTAQVPGTGLGLSIARGLMEAMGGTIAAANRSAPAAGLSVRLELAAA